MSKRTKTGFIILLSLVVLLVIPFKRLLVAYAFFAMQADSIREAGTWEDDPKNWYRAFHEEPPGEVKVVHSKYWRSDHFTVEFMYYFEMEAAPEWRDKYLAKHNLQRVSPETARSFRMNHSSKETPAWFAPDPVDRYDVWDNPGCFGHVWIDKTNGHIFIYEWRL